MTDITNMAHNTFITSSGNIEFQTTDLNISNIVLYSTYFKVLEEYRNSEYFENTPADKEQIITLPPILTVPEYISLFKILSNARSVWIAARWMWHCISESDPQKYIEILTFLSCDDILEQLVGYIAYLYRTQAHVFFGMLLNIYDERTHLGKCTLRNLSEMTEIPSEKILPKIITSDGERRFSINKIRKLLRDTSRLQEHLAKRKIVPCGLCGWQMAYTNLDGGWQLKLGGRMPCCGFVVHAECFWKELGKEDSLYQCTCGGALSVDTGKLVPYESTLYSAMYVIGRRRLQGVPLNVDIPPPKR